MKLTEASWKRFTGALAEFEGWSARLRSDFGPHAAELVIAHRLLELDALTPAEPSRRRSRALPSNGYTLSVLERDDDRLRVKVVEEETSAAQIIGSAAELLSSPIYANLRKAYAKLVEIVGPPPFKLALGKKTRRGAHVLRPAHERSTSRRKSASSSRASRASAR